MLKRLQAIEDKILTTPKWIEKINKVFSTGDFNKLSAEDAGKLILSMPDRYKILTDEIVKQMQEAL